MNRRNFLTTLSGFPIIGGLFHQENQTQISSDKPANFKRTYLILYNQLICSDKVDISFSSTLSHSEHQLVGMLLRDALQIKNPTEHPLWEIPPNTIIYPSSYSNRFVLSWRNKLYYGEISKLNLFANNHNRLDVHFLGYLD